MFRSEIQKILRSNKIYIVLVFFVFIMSLDLFLVWKIDVLADYFKHPEAYDYIRPTGADISHPAVAGFLSASSKGHIAQMLIKWLLPIFLLWAYSDSYINEKKYSYNILVLGRSSRKKTIINQILVAFISAFTTMLIALSINFIMSIILFHGGYFFHGMDSPEMYNGLYWMDQFEFSHAYIAYLIHMLLFCVFAGICNILCLSISNIFHKYAIVYPVCFFLWVVVWVTGFDISVLFQPLTGELKLYLPKAALAVAYLFGVTIISMIVFIRLRLKTDEL